MIKSWIFEFFAGPPQPNGFVDHLTCGRLEIGTAAGIPQEMAQVGERLRADPRLDLPDRPAVLIYRGMPATVADGIVAQCCEAGAGHFAALFDRTMAPEVLMEWYRDYGAVTIPKLLDARV